MHTYVVLAVPSSEGRTSKKKIEKKINRFLKSENTCFFINSPTFPVLFPFLVYTGG